MRASLAFPGALALAAIAATAAANGGYFPQEWGWAMLGPLLAAVLAVLVRERVALSRLELALVAAFAAFALWTLLSVAWATSATEPVLSFERVLVYVAFVAALVLVATPPTAPLLLAGVLAAATGVCAYALLTRVLPGRLESFPPPDGSQLSEPIGYWNGLGILAAIGALLALAFAVELEDRRLRAAATGVLPVLLTALYLTFSRGSSAAFALGIAVAVAAARGGRLRAAGAVVWGLPASALAVLAARHESALTGTGASLASAAGAGHRLAAVLAACTVVSAALGWFRPRGGTLRALGIALAAAVLLAAVAGVVRAGGPVALVHRATRSFTAPLPATGGDLNRRLGSLSSNGRSDYWRVAAIEVGDHPLLGGGAGSYERYWHRHRRSSYESRNAHDLYLETLAELGPVGLALLLCGLAVPVVALVRVGGPGALGAGAYAAFVVHAAVDWDWQLPAVTFAGLACGVAIVVGAARRPGGAPTPWRPRAAALGLLLPLVAFAIAVEVGNSALARSEAAANRDDAAAAARLARRAHTWAPWSAQPWQRLGEAQALAGDTAAARRSFEHAIRVDPTDWTLWAALAQAERGAARSRAASEARRLDPLGG